jgi:hypothetical protein
VRQLRRLPRPLQRAIRLGYVGTRVTRGMQDGSGWASTVRAIKVELHGSHTREACEAEPRHWACVEGMRP